MNNLMKGGNWLFISTLVIVLVLTIIASELQ